MNRACFGPAGSSDAFSARHKSSVEMPAYLAQMGLDCFEYQCGRGVQIGPEKAGKLGEEAARHGIALSLHAPYFINLSSPDPERMEKNTDYILQAARACRWMGGDRIVVHCGGLSKMTRQEAMANTCATLAMVLDRLAGEGLEGIALCIETMGKINVLGDLDEVLEICRRDGRLVPCIDFGHLNCRTGGGVNSPAAFDGILTRMAEALGEDRARVFHGHFSKIEYSRGGEVRHLTFADTVYGPEFAPLGQLLARRDWAPRIICESAGTQDADARTMKESYLRSLDPDRINI